MNRQTAACLAVLLAFAGAASGTTFVEMADADLAAQATAIVRGEVLAVEPGPMDRLPSTEYLVEVEELIQGHLPGGTIVVRVPGGIRGDGLGLKIWGAPELRPGEEVLLFLDRGDDGTYGILHLMLGAFHARGAGPGATAERELGAARALGSAAGAAEGEGVRDLGRFVSWLADRAAGIERAADYWSRRGGTRTPATAKAFAPLPTTDGVAPRWFDFDDGFAVEWLVSVSGQPGLGPDRTVAAVRAALDAWTSDPTSDVHYAYGGTTSSTAGMGSPDKTNAILFDDPHGQVPGTFDCKKGGVLAIGGPYFWASTRGFRGEAFHEIAEADIVTNDGAACWFADNVTGAAEAFAHELGHTLGFGHATDAQAVMWPKAHDDGRGARLDDDDRMGASLFYGDGTYRPAPEPDPAPKPSKPFTLKARATRTEVALTWRHNLPDAETFCVERQPQKGVFEVLFTVPGGSNAATIGGLAPNQALTLRVTALRADGMVVGSSKVIRVRTRK